MDNLKQFNKHHGLFITNITLRKFESIISIKMIIFRKKIFLKMNIKHFNTLKLNKARWV